MVSELELKEIIGKVLKEMAVEGTSVNNEVKKPSTSTSVIENGIIDDITKEDLREIIELKNPANREEFLKYKRKNSCKIRNIKSRFKIYYTYNVKIKSRPCCSTRCCFK